MFVYVSSRFGSSLCLHSGGGKAGEVHESSGCSTMQSRVRVSAECRRTAFIFQDSVSLMLVIFSFLA